MTKQENDRTFIEEVRSATDIVGVVQKHLPLDHSNMGRCPFHKDRNPSLSVVADGQYFHCFGCGVGGDVFDFLQQIERKPFWEIVEDLAHAHGISIPAESAEARLQAEAKRQVQEVLAASARYYQHCFEDSVRAYLVDERGITDGSIHRFQIGYARGGLARHLLETCGFDSDLCLRSGVLREDAHGGVEDYFRDRIVFPIFKDGRVVNLSARTLRDGDPKYLNLPGPICHLYNEDELGAKEVLLTEGILDCISAVQAGHSAIAALGARTFSPHHLERLNRCNIINICMDGDPAGRTGALKVGGMLGTRARIVSLPDGLDVNEFLRVHGKVEFDRLISEAVDPIRFELETIPPDISKTDLRRRLDPVLRQLATMEQADVEAYLTYEIKARFGLRAEDIKAYRGLVSRYRSQHTSDPENDDDAAEVKYKANFPGLIDLVEGPEGPAFLTMNGEAMEVETQVERDSVVLVPPPRDQIPFLLPDASEVLRFHELERSLTAEEADAALYDDVRSYLKNISELPSEGHYDLLTAWVLHTHLLDEFQYSPILCLFAVPERGKSRTGKALTYLARRGIVVESLRDAYLVRIASRLQATIFFDVMDLWRKAERKESEDILLHRFERGATVPRVLYPDRGEFQDTVYFDIFGPTIIGTNVGMHLILETRCITINMPETSIMFENAVTPQSALPLKGRLLGFRSRHLGKAMPDVRKPAPGRLGDILQPLVQVVALSRPDRVPVLHSIIAQLQSARLIEKAESPEAQLLNVVMALEDHVNKGVLQLKLITETLNAGKQEKFKFSPHRIGRTASAMGFQKRRTGDGAVAIIWDEDLIARLRKTYGLDAPSVSSESPDPALSAVTDHTDLSALFQEAV
jgi:DNA primase catalytic core